MNGRTRRREIVGAMCSIIAVAFGLRVWAIGWGLPYVDHPAEPAVVNPTLAMLRRDDWQPHFFNYPSLYIYALRFVFSLHWFWESRAGLYNNLRQIPTTTDIFTTMPGFYIWGRALTIGFGVASVGLVAVIGRRWFSTNVGLVAAAILATLPFHVRHSQYITTDVASGFMATLALWAALRLLDGPSWRRGALAGLAVGLAAGTKYNVGLVAGAVAVAHIVVWQLQSWRQAARLLSAAGCSVLGFLLTTPTIVWDFAQFTRDMQRQIASYSGGHGDAIGRWPLGEYLDFFWFDGLRIVPFVAALLGLAWLLRRRNRAGLITLGFGLPYLLFAMAQQTHFFRNMLPLFPLLALWGGYGVIQSAEWLAARTRTNAALVGTALAGLVLVYPLLKSIEITRFEAIPNSKVLAADYVRAMLPRGLPVAVEQTPLQWAGSPSVLPVANLASHDRAWYAAQGIRYLLANEYQRTADTQPQYVALLADARLVQRFVGNENGKPGPELAVYDLGLTQTQLDLEPQTAQFGAALRLLGFQRSVGEPRATITPLDGTSELKSGQPLRLNLYWQVEQPLDQDYSLFLHVLNANGDTVAQRDTVIRAGDYPTSHWQVGEIVLDTPDLPLPALPPGRYQLKMGLYDSATFARLPVSANPAATTDNGLILLPLEIAP